MPTADPGQRRPDQVPLESVTDAVVRFVQDETLTGRVLRLNREEDPRLLNYLVRTLLD